MIPEHTLDARQPIDQRIDGASREILRTELAIDDLSSTVHKQLKYFYMLSRRNPTKPKQKTRLAKLITRTRGEIASRDHELRLYIQRKRDVQMMQKMWIEDRKYVNSQHNVSPDEQLIFGANNADDEKQFSPPTSQEPTPSADAGGTTTQPKPPPQGCNKCTVDTTSCVHVQIAVPNQTMCDKITSPVKAGHQCRVAAQSAPSVGAQTPDVKSDVDVPTSPTTNPPVQMSKRRKAMNPRQRDQEDARKAKKKSQRAKAKKNKERKEQKKTRKKSKREKKMNSNDAFFEAQVFATRRVENDDNEREMKRDPKKNKRRKRNRCKGDRDAKRMKNEIEQKPPKIPKTNPLHPNAQILKEARSSILSFEKINAAIIDAQTHAEKFQPPEPIQPVPQAATCLDGNQWCPVHGCANMKGKGFEPGRSFVRHIYNEKNGHRDICTNPLHPERENLGAALARFNRRFCSRQTCHKCPKVSKRKSNGMCVMCEGEDKKNQAIIDATPLTDLQYHQLETAIRKARATRFYVVTHIPKCIAYQWSCCVLQCICQLRRANTNLKWLQAMLQWARLKCVLAKPINRDGTVCKDYPLSVHSTKMDLYVLHQQEHVWNSAVATCLPKSSNKPKKQKPLTDRQREDGALVYGQEAVSKGDLSRAANRITSNGAAPSNKTADEFLAKKFEKAPRPMSPTEEEVQAELAFTRAMYSKNKDI